MQRSERGVEVEVRPENVGKALSGAVGPMFKRGVRGSFVCNCNFHRHCAATLQYMLLVGHVATSMARQLEVELSTPRTIRPS